MLHVIIIEFELKKKIFNRILSKNFLLENKFYELHLKKLREKKKKTL